MGKVEGGVEWDDAELERNLQPDTCTLVGSHIHETAARKEKGTKKGSDIISGVHRIPR